MNVLFLSHSFPRFPGDPVGSFVLRLAVALAGQGVTVRVVAPAGPGLAGQDTIEGIAVERFRYAPRRWETLAYTGTMAQQVAASWGGKLALAGLVIRGSAAGARAGRDFAVDVIHAHWWFPGGLIGSWLARSGTVPLVTTLHGSDVRVARRGGPGRRLFRSVLRRSRRVTAVSRWLAREAEAMVPGIKPEVAPMPVLPDAFRPAEGRQRNRLLFVGKLNRQKGAVDLLQALARMTSRPTLDVVVGVGSEEAPLRELAVQLGVADRIRWHPLLPQSELARLYQQATVLLVPSIDEGLGLVAIEAQLSGIPVVAYDSGGLPDIVVSGATGMLVPPGDVNALAAATDRILGLPDQGSAWGEAGRQHALEVFAPEAAARRYLDIYSRAIADRRA